MNSSIVLALIVLVAVVAGEELTLQEKQEKFLQILKTCREENNVSKESALKIKARDFSEDTDNVHCFVKCTVEKTGFLKGNVFDDEKILKVDAALNTIDPEKSADRLAKCKVLYPTIDDCKAAFNAYKCFKTVV